MSRNQIANGVLIALVTLGLGLLFCGCEAESAASAEIIVTPPSATLAVGQSVTLTASGWEDYRWSLADESIGTLSPRTGETVVYTSIASGGTNSSSVQTVTVTGLGMGGTSDTNSQSQVVTGQAVIRHI